MRTVPVSSNLPFPFPFLSFGNEIATSAKKNASLLLKIELSRNVDRQQFTGGRTSRFWSTRAFTFSSALFLVQLEVDEICLKYVFSR